MTGRCRNAVTGAFSSVAFLPTVAILLLVLAGCGQEAGPVVFNAQLRSSPSTLDPATTTSIYTLAVGDRIFDGVVKLNRENGGVAPNLAESWEISDDGLVYTFKLRDGIRFHNGRPITAADVKYSWERVLAPETASPHVYLLEMIEGATAFHAGDADAVSGIRPLDDQRFEVRLAERDETFLYLLAIGATVIVPREAIEELGPRFGQAPVGSGPFRLARWARDFRIELEPFAEHYEPPAVDRLIYHVLPEGEESVRLFETGDLDLAVHVPPHRQDDLRQRYATSLRELPSFGWGGFGFRCDQPPFDDARVRQAIRLAIDRLALADALGQPRHTAAFGIIPPAVPGHEPTTREAGADLERSRALLAKAGYPNGDGLPLLLYANRHGNEAVGELIAAALAEIGLRVRIELHSFQTIVDGVESGRFNFFYLGWTGGFPDPDVYLRPIVHSRSGPNISRYSNPEVDAWLDAARAEGDPERRTALYQQAEQRVLEDAPYVALYHWDEVFLLHERWKGIPLGLRPEYLEIERAFLP